MKSFRRWVDEVDASNAKGAQLEGVRRFLLLRADGFQRTRAPKFLEEWRKTPLPGGPSFNYGTPLT